MPDDRREAPPTAPPALPPGTWVPIERGPNGGQSGEGGTGGGPGAGRDARRRRARRRLAALIVLTVVGFAVGLGVGVVRAYLSPGEVGAEVRVTIPEGSSLKQIAAILAKKGVVEHANLFVYQVKDDGHENDLKPGAYVLHVNEPYDDLVALLVQGVAAPTVDVTLPEGLTIAEQARRIARAVPGFDAATYVQIATQAPPEVKVEGYEAGTTLEGLLFPATYEVRDKVKPRVFIELQLAALRENLDKVDMTRARKANLTEYDVIIIASLIEGEARVADERDLVGAVVWNRLREGMMLQIDAAIQYALGERKPALTYDDYKVESPYNVYKYAGLTPTPINSPGLAALRAAANPARVDYLYYVARADGSGRHYWSHDYDQFLRDKARAGQNAE
jgi:uncharacterized YceG family protein